MPSSIDLMVWNHVYREANFATNYITYVGHNCNNLCIWDDCIPQQAGNTLLYYSRDLECYRGFCLN